MCRGPGGTATECSRKFCSTTRAGAHCAASTSSYRDCLTLTKHCMAPSCPYAHRTWLALEELEQEYETRKVDLTNKSKEFVDLYHEVYPDPQGAQGACSAVSMAPYVILCSCCLVALFSNLRGAVLYWGGINLARVVWPMTTLSCAHAAPAKVPIIVDTDGFALVESNITGAASYPSYCALV